MSVLIFLAELKIHFLAGLFDSSIEEEIDPVLGFLASLVSSISMLSNSAWLFLYFNIPN